MRYKGNDLPVPRFTTLCPFFIHESMVGPDFPRVEECPYIVTSLHQLRVLNPEFEIPQVLEEA